MRAYSRALNEVTDYVPEVIAAAAAMPARKLILDGEAIVLGPGGRPLPFQDTMRRFGKKGIELKDTMPLSLSVFDALLVDDQTLLAEPASRRFEVLAAMLAPDHAVNSGFLPSRFSLQPSMARWRLLPCRASRRRTLQRAGPRG